MLGPQPSSGFVCFESGKSEGRFFDAEFLMAFDGEGTRGSGPDVLVITGVNKRREDFCPEEGISRWAVDGSGCRVGNRFVPLGKGAFRDGMF